MTEPMSVTVNDQLSAEGSVKCPVREPILTKGKGEILR